MEVFFTDPQFLITAWGKLYKSSLFASIRYPIGKYHEDVFTTHLLLHEASVVIWGAKARYYYRQRTGSIVNSAFQVKHLDSLEGMQLQQVFIRKYYPALTIYANAGVAYSSAKCTGKLRLDLYCYLPSVCP